MNKQNIEVRVRRKRTRIKIQDGLILALRAGATISLAVAAPNAMKLLEYLPEQRTKVPIGKRVAQARSRLIARGLIDKSVKDGHVAYVLTTKGDAYAQELESRHSVPAVPRTWDGNWRIVIFDVWESRRRVRDTLRARLRSIGFTQLQNSVWVYPYPCEGFISFARTELKLGSSLVYIVACEIENDSKLRRHFRLPTRD